MTKVKICGLTNLEDAIVAAEARADFLGFILWDESKRGVSVAVVAGICQQLRRLPKCPILVGVFVNETIEKMAAVLAECGLDLAQLSGDEVPAFINDPKSPIYGCSYKAIRPTSLSEAEAEAEWFTAEKHALNHPSLLIDTYHPTLRGGTGELTDWGIAAKLAAGIPGFMLAGGLSPSNVAEAVAQVQPFAVDVASGVEESAGIKNHEAVKRFITAVNSKQ